MTLQKFFNCIESYLDLVKSMERRLCGFLFCSPCLCCGLVDRGRFSSSCGDRFVNIGDWLVLVFVPVACPTVRYSRPNVAKRTCECVARRRYLHCRSVPYSELGLKGESYRQKTCQQNFDR
jgi:hypothetical protein